MLYCHFLLATLFHKSHAYICGENGSLDCLSANMTLPLIIGSGSVKELKDCKYSRCPSIDPPQCDAFSDYIFQQHGCRQSPEWPAANC